MKQTAKYMGEIRPTWDDSIKAIEQAGRVCYRSEDKITADSARAFALRASGKGHSSVLRFSNRVARWNSSSSDLPVNANGKSYFIREGSMVAGNYQAWMEYFNGSCSLSQFEHFFQQRTVPDEHVPDELRLHWAMVETDRAVSHELVRHQSLSFLQESQRYCSYEGGLKFIDQNWVHDLLGVSPADGLSEEDMENGAMITTLLAQAERQATASYREIFSLLRLSGVTRTKAAEAARVVLPNMTATRVAVCGYPSGWRHFFNVRTVKGSVYNPMYRLAVELEDQMGLIVGL